MHTYLCTHCKYSDFDSPEVKQYAGMAGCDMPDKICPKCGTRMKKEGFDIPFETFRWNSREIKETRIS